MTVPSGQPLHRHDDPVLVWSASVPARQHLMCKLLFTGLVALLLALPLPASALCPLCSCTVNATPVAYGTYDPMSSTPLDSDGSVLFTCGGLIGGVVSYDITLGKGVYSTNFSPRKMSSGINLLDYDLYTSSAYSSIWGDGTAGTQKISGNVTILVLGGTTKNVVVYGRIPGSQSIVKAGVYSDAVVITVTYN